MTSLTAISAFILMFFAFLPTEFNLRWQIHVVQLVYGKGSEAAMSIRNVISIEKDTDVICDSQDVQVHFDGKTVVFAVFSSDSELYFGSHAISFDSNAIEKCLLQSIRCTSSVDEDDKV